MSISNPFARPSPFKPISYTNKIQQSQVLPFNSSSPNYSKWQPKHLTNRKQYPTYNNYTATNQYHPTFTNKTAAYHDFDVTNVNKQYSIPNYQHKKQYQVSPTPIAYHKDNTTGGDKNPFNRPSLLLKPSYLPKEESYDHNYQHNNSKYENLRYQGNTIDYTTGKSYIKDFDSRSQSASVATYINKIIEIDDRKSQYGSGTNTSRIGYGKPNIGYENNYQSPYTTQQNKYSPKRQSITELQHLRYRPSRQSASSNMKQNSSQNNISPYLNNYLDDDIGMLRGRSKTNNEEENRYDYHYGYTEKKRSYDYEGYGNRNRQQISDYKKGNRRDDNQFGIRYRQQQGNRYYRQQQLYKHNRFDDGIPSNQYGNTNTYNKLQYQKNYGYSNQNIINPKPSFDDDIENRRKTLKFEDFKQDDDEDQSPEPHINTYKASYPPKIDQQQSDRDQQFDFNQQDSFQRNLNQPKKTKIWGKGINEGQNQRLQSNNGIQYTEPCFGRKNRNQQYSSPEFYVSSNRNREEKVMEPSFNSKNSKNGDEIVKFEDSDEEPTYHKSNPKQNIPSMDIDNNQEYPKIIEVQGILFHRLEFVED